jgi:hypothetical protein
VILGIFSYDTVFRICLQTTQPNADDNYVAIDKYMVTPSNLQYVAISHFIGHAYPLIHFAIYHPLDSYYLYYLSSVPRKFSEVIVVL